MKRWIVWMLMAVLCLTVCGCARSQEEELAAVDGAVSEEKLPQKEESSEPAPEEEEQQPQQEQKPAAQPEQEQKPQQKPDSSGKKKIISMDGYQAALSKGELAEKASLIVKVRVSAKAKEEMLNPDGKQNDAAGNLIENALITSYTAAVQKVYKGVYDEKNITVKTSEGYGLSPDLILYGEDEKFVLDSPLRRFTLEAGKEYLLFLVSGNFVFGPEAGCFTLKDGVWSNGLENNFSEGELGLFEIKGFSNVAEKIKAGKEINLLMIGNSYNYYFVEELARLAAAAKIKLRVCYLYYGGCSLEKHYNMWQAGDQLCKYSETLGAEQTVQTGFSMERCLQQRKWDVISLQPSSTTTRKTAEKALTDTQPYREMLYGMLRERFPEATLLYHQYWTFEIGHTKSGGYVMKDKAQQTAYTATVREIANTVCIENQVHRVNTGDAWELYREACDQKGIAHNLCARLGVEQNGDPHGGDGTHDGDIGGGQLLNAYVWYEILTGLDCRENTYQPVYQWNGSGFSLDQAKIKMLQDAAHKAVNEILPTYKVF
ncbi:MAG: DUF4886 domain-containing protein [Clostridia bacterium]|nr:DUF4886 domain-containing protein [Clostridia bacterium]